jgi:2-methylcitrate dehydratase PrpD
MIAQYSVPFAVALALFRNPQDPRSFDQSAVDDPKIKALCKRVRLHREEGAGHMTPGASVTLKLNDGRVLTKRVVYFKGTPQAPANRDDVYEKFQVLTRDCPRQRMDQIFERLQNIERERDFDWLKVSA